MASTGSPVRSSRSNSRLWLSTKSTRARRGPAMNFVLHTSDECQCRPQRELHGVKTQMNDDDRPAPWIRDLESFVDPRMTVRILLVLSAVVIVIMGVVQVAGVVFYDRSYLSATVGFLLPILMIGLPLLLVARSERRRREDGG
jgi:hypothetical protein